MPTTEPPSPSASWPASVRQQRLVRSYQRESGDPTQHLTVQIRIDGGLDRLLLVEAIALLVSRHEVLRTRLCERQGRIVQMVERALEVPILLEAEEQHDVANDARTRAVLLACATTPFDLERGPLCRFHLVTRSPLEHLLIVGLHASVADQQTVRLLFWDLLAIYAAKRQGAPLGPSPERPFREYAREEVALLALRESERRYWAERLRDLPEAQLGAAAPGPSVRARRHRWQLSRADLERLETHAMREGTSAFRVMLSLWASLLSQRTREVDLVIATPTDRRPQGFRGSSGSFANTVPLRCDVTGDPSLRELTERLDRSVRKDLSAADLPLEEILASAGRRATPTFRFGFVWQGREPPPVDAAELRWRLLPSSELQRDAVGDGAPAWSLGLCCGLGREHVELGLVEQSLALDTAATEALAEELTALIRAALAQPDQPLRALAGAAGSGPTVSDVASAMAEAS